MIDVTIFFFFQNIVLLTTLFWFLSWFGKKFFKEKNNSASYELFECGFLPTTNFNIKINFNIFLVAILLILYDVEFLFLVPFFYNISAASVFGFIVFFNFLAFVVSTFIYD